ncbi:hypothetical protein MmiHf6_00650 [Methanimicrococcus hongohii]|uniref:Swt1-like HEPN domain-containing protein n=1 Tax=Methanimicrococcus hongohii TaxID=3028295 RepID=A0AA96UYM4_9EURY|nr:Swt1 family HEPN domain-containing protein [Methanimicrococcus sp. Hf6]WNY22780.1 hypothetical protein MmiHf6_00650 [Methanimicrococcus sp. Hf6]
MAEKKTVSNFLRKTFALKKNEEETGNEKKTAAKTTAKPAAKTTAKPAAKTAAKPATKAAAKPAAKTTAKPTTKAAAKSAAKTAVKPAAKTAVKPAAKTAAKPAAKTAASAAPAAAAPAPKSTPPVAFSKNMTKADNVRFYIYQNYFKPAKLKGQSKITLVAGDIHTDMGLKSEMPTVTAAMKTRIDRLYDVEILDVKPPGGANSKLTVKYDLKNLYMEEEAVKPVTEKIEKLGGAGGGTGAGNVKTAAKQTQTAKQTADSENSYLILKELEEKLRSFVSDRVEARFGKEWWKGTDMSFLADRWNERRIMNDRTNADKKRSTNEPLINYASFSDYRRIINNPFAWDAFEEYFPDRGWIIQRLKELDPIRNAIMHHTPLEDDDYIRLSLYSRDILKIIDQPNGKGKK